MEKKANNNLIAPAAIIAFALLAVSGTAIWVAIGNQNPENLKINSQVANVPGKLNFASYSQETAP
ncbi:MAG: hypothetical protein PHH08_02645, partial [Candidatus ainarchaeum sp.]|nr:hypothetical protein [Candidatus ainarchaeum sp.]